MMVRTLWAAGMVVWYFLSLRKLSQVPRWTPNAAAAALFAAMAGGFLLSRYGFHLYDSTVALAGAVLGAFLYLLFTRRLTRWRDLLEAACWAFPFAWILVRLGCVVERAHGGAASHSWLAVTFPDGVSRWDLALLEMLWATAVAGWLVARPKARAAIVVPATLAVVRLAMNPVRAGEPVYLSAAILAAWAVFVWLHGRNGDASIK
jgi:prolipoprotein diacylglyceryltransferase